MEDVEEYYDREVESAREYRYLMRLEERHGERFHEWIEDGVPTAAMKSESDIEAYRERKGTPVPWDIETYNMKSVARNAGDTNRRLRRGPDGETRVPEVVREVISSRGRSLDGSFQQTVEEQLGDSLGDVRIHTGARAADAAEAIDARAFTVGNHIVFNHGEYDPESPEGQHVLAHELAHVRQQTGGTLSMLPQEDVALEVDPDPELEREAEETAERVVLGGDVGIQRLSDTAIHVQRATDEEIDVVDDPEVLAALKTALSQSTVTSSDFFDHLRSIGGDQREEIERVIEEYELLAASAIVNVYKYHYVEGNPDRILSPAEIARRINELQRSGVTIYKGTFERLYTDNSGAVKGGSFEVELAYELENNGKEIKSISGKIQGSDMDILISDDVVYEAKNNDFEEEDYSNFFFDLFEKSIDNKVKAYIKDTNKDLVVSFRSAIVDERAREKIEKIESEYNIDIKIRTDKGYVENE